MQDDTAIEELGTGPPGNSTWKSIFVQDLDLDAEICHIFKQAKILTVQDVLDVESGKGLLKIGGIWQKQYRDICRALREVGASPDGKEVEQPHKAVPKTPVTPLKDMSAGELSDAGTLLKSAGTRTVRDLSPDGKAMELPRREVEVAPTETRPPLFAQTIAIGTEQRVEKAGLRTVVFVDFEHWHVSLKTLYQRRPNIQTWFDDAKTRGKLLEVTFFGDFSDTGGMRDEINYIRRFTNRIIETKNTSLYSKKSFTDFIMLDVIYQKVFAFPEIEQVILFTGDGDFCSVASYLRNFCSKVVGVYCIDGAISNQLEAIADWCVRLPLDVERYAECRKAILKNLRYTEAHALSPTFRHTVRLVSEHYQMDDDLVESELRQLIEEGIVYTMPQHSRRDYGVMVNILKVNWDMVENTQQKPPIEVG